MSKKDRHAPGTDPDKVIHVIFGPGGGRVSEPVSVGDAARPSETKGPSSAPLAGHAREPVSDLFTGPEVVRLLGISVGRLRSLNRSGFTP